jgi:hypothetical protein
MHSPFRTAAVAVGTVFLASCAASRSSGAVGDPGAVAPASSVRSVPFVVRATPVGSAHEYLEGVALVGPDAIDVLVSGAQLAEDTPRATLLRLRAGVFEGDTAGRWGGRHRSAPVPVSRIRALTTGAGRDTVRLRIPRTAGLALDARWLGFEIEGRVTPPGMAEGPGYRTLHGERGGLVAR